MKTYLREGERAADGVGVQGCLSIFCALLGDLLALLELVLSRLFAYSSTPRARRRVDRHADATPG